MHLTSPIGCPFLQARVATADVLELLEGAEAKAYYGLAINWKPLQALTQALLDRNVLQVRRAHTHTRTAVHSAAHIKQRRFHH